MLLQDERTRSFCRTRGFDVAQLRIRPVGISGRFMLWQPLPQFDTLISEYIYADPECLTVAVKLKMTGFVRVGSTLNIFNGDIQFTLVSSWRAPATTWPLYNAKYSLSPSLHRRSRRPLTCRKTSKGLLAGRLGCGALLKRVKGTGARTQWICPNCNGESHLLKEYTQSRPVAGTRRPSS